MEKVYWIRCNKFVIWTTTPWTIPANLGISVHPDLNYVVVKENGQKYLVAARTIRSGNHKNWLGKSTEIVQTIKGQELDRIVATHPFYERDSLVMFGEHVTIGCWYWLCSYSTWTWGR